MTENEVKETREWLQDFIRMFGCNFDDLETRGFNECVMFLKELEQYRAIGTPTQIYEKIGGLDVELGNYHAIGTIEEFRKLKKMFGDDFSEMSEVVKRILKEYPEYQSIGTIEEFKVLKEKSVPIVTGEWIDTQPQHNNGYYKNAYVCSNCNDYYTTEYDEMKFCPNCGAKMTET